MAYHATNGLVFSSIMYGRSIFLFRMSGTPFLLCNIESGVGEILKKIWVYKLVVNIKCYHWNSPSGPPGLWKYNSQYGFINYGGSVGYCEMVSIWDAYQRFLIIPTKKTIWIWKCKKTDTNVNSKKSWIKAQNSEQFLVLAVIQICWSQICWTVVLDANQRSRTTKWRHTKPTNKQKQASLPGGA